MLVVPPPYRPISELIGIIEAMSFTGVVLALDLASTTGWAAGMPGDTPAFGHVRLSKPGGSRAATYRSFREWLDVMPRMPDIIVYELPMQPLHMKLHTNIDTSKLLMGLAEHLEEWALGKTELREATVGQVSVTFHRPELKSAIAKPKTVQTCIDRGWPVEHHGRSRRLRAMGLSGQLATPGPRCRQHSPVQARSRLNPGWYLSWYLRGHGPERPRPQRCAGAGIQAPR